VAPCYEADGSRYTFVGVYMNVSILSLERPSDFALSYSLSYLQDFSFVRVHCRRLFSSISLIPVPSLQTLVVGSRITLDHCYATKSLSNTNNASIGTESVAHEEQARRILCKGIVKGKAGLGCRHFILATQSGNTGASFPSTREGPPGPLRQPRGRTVFPGRCAS